MSKRTPQTLALSTEQEEEFKKNLKHLKSKETGGMIPGVVYIGHIPHGFYEDQMRNFFSQFGVINRLRISRSKKTGGCKGYAFIEFQCDEVAKIVAETMNNYLMFRKLLKCEFMAPDRVHANTFLGADRPFKKSCNQEIAIAKNNMPQTLQQKKRALQKMDKKNKKKISKLSSMGIEYSFDGLKSQIDKVIEKETELNNTAIEEVKKSYHVLFDDSSEEEVEFKTPPGTIRSSKVIGSQKKRKSTNNVDPNAATPEHTPKVKKSKIKSEVTVVAAKDDVVKETIQRRRVLPRKAKLVQPSKSIQSRKN